MLHKVDTVKEVTEQVYHYTCDYCNNKIETYGGAYYFSCYFCDKHICSKHNKSHDAYVVQITATDRYGDVPQCCEHCFLNHPQLKELVQNKINELESDISHLRSFIDVAR